MALCEALEALSVLAGERLRRGYFTTSPSVRLIEAGNSETKKQRLNCSAEKLNHMMSNAKILHKSECPEKKPNMITVPFSRTLRQKFMLFGSELIRRNPTKTDRQHPSLRNVDNAVSLTLLGPAFQGQSEGEVRTIGGL
jgi:hypothetical protein